MLAAPSAVVAVPTTVAPSCASAIAMALPIPRVAPVTSAICVESDPIVTARSSARPDRGERFFETGAIVDRERRHGFVDASRETGQHLARTAFDDVGDATRCKGLNRFAPAHGARRLEGQRAANRLRSRMLGDVDVMDDRNGRR